jgi:hypothetical protein
MNSSTEMRAQGAGEQRDEAGLPTPAALRASPPSRWSLSSWVSRAGLGARLVASFGLLFWVAQGCGSPTQQLAEPQTNTQTNTGAATGSAGASTSPTTTPVAPVTAGEVVSCEGANPHPTCPPLNTDANCNSANASTGETCTIDCRLGCGFNGLGLKHCTCQGGTYESCPCPRPDTYRGAPTATFCTVGTGMSSELDETPCAAEWDQCVARDPVTGTPRGCACLKNATGALEWTCGSTNNWFALESETGDGVCEGATPDPTCFPVNTDASCNSTNARTGSICSRDCRVGCGYQQMGLKICTCAGGVYSQCPCPRPDGYMGAATAPNCTTPDGMTTALDDQPCTVEWEQCIGSDPVTGNTPRGCVCMTNRLSGALQWYCGSTNRWFAPQ